MNNLDRIIKLNPHAGVNCSIIDINIEYSESKYLRSYYIGRDNKHLSYYVVVIKYKTNYFCYLTVLNNEKQLYSIDINSVKVVTSESEIENWVKKCKLTFNNGR